MVYLIGMNAIKTVIEKMSSYQNRQAELKLDSRELGALISALKLAEEKAAVLSSIIESTDDAIVSKDLNGTITSWNKSAERIFGFSESEMIGYPILKLIPGNLQDEEPRIIEQIKKGIRVDHFETQRLRKDGSLVDVSLTISPIFDSVGNIIGISKIARDMTLHRKAEIDARRLAAIVETSDDAIISKDFNSIIISWNDSAFHMFGYTAEEMIGQSILKIIPADRHNEEPQILDQLRQGNRVQHFETQRLRKDGRLIDVSLTISPVKDSMGKVIGLSKIARDITERKATEKMKSDFVGFVTHELKTPLTSLKSYLQIALKKSNEEAFLSMVLDRAQLQADKMSAMITDFLDMSRMEDGLLKMEMEEFDLSSLLRECAEDAKILSEKHEVVCNIEHGLYVCGDSSKLSMVITNLINNAQKYSPDGGRIKISCIRNSGSILVSIADEGIGISHADQLNMFKKFHRVESERTKGIPGFGIGLYLASIILSLHASVFRVDSSPGNGSTFSFELAPIV
jgi:two-component system sensor histidine kinase VicK